jgi:hypothetical protein
VQTDKNLPKLGFSGEPRKLFDNDQSNSELHFALRGAHYGAGDLGEMLSTADRIVDGDADSWCQSGLRPDSAWRQ